MSVFKSVLVSFWRNRTVVLFYLIIFLVISLSTLSKIDDAIEAQFKPVKPSVLLIDQTENSPFNSHFKDYLETIVSVDQTVQDLNLARDLIESDRYDMLIVMAEDGAARLDQGKTVFDSYYHAQNSLSILLREQINSYFRYLAASPKVDGQFDYATVKKIIAQRVDVKLIAQNRAPNSKAIWFSFYLINGAFAILIIFTTLIISVLKMYHDPVVIARRSLAKLSRFKQSLLMGAASASYLVAIALLFFVIGLALVRFAVPPRQILLHLLNMLAFASTVISFALLLNCFNIKPRFSSAVANVVALGTSFTAGIFVPIEFLPTIVRNFAKLLPAYYYAKLANGIAQGGVNIPLLIGIQLLFTLCYSSITWYLSQQN